MFLFDVDLILFDRGFLLWLLGLELERLLTGEENSVAFEAHLAIQKGVMNLIIDPISKEEKVSLHVFLHNLRSEIFEFSLKLKWVKYLLIEIAAIFAILCAAGAVNNTLIPFDDLRGKVEHFGGGGHLEEIVRFVFVKLHYSDFCFCVS